MTNSRAVSPPRRVIKEQNEYYQLSCQTNGDQDDGFNRQLDNNGCSGGTEMILGGYAATTSEHNNSKEDIIDTFGVNTRRVSK